MTHRRFYGVEKLQVQLTTVAAVVAAYFLIWPLVRPPDPADPAVFVASGSYGRIALLGVAVCVLAVVCGLATVSARPEGAMLAMLIGTGGISLHSPSIRALLWVRQGDLGGLYWQMALEMVLLAVVGLAGAVVLYLVRRAAGQLVPSWLWRDPLRDMPEEQQRACVRAEAERDGRDGEEAGGLIGGGFARIIVEDLGVRAARRSGRRGIGGAVLTRCGLCFLTTLAIALGLVLLLLRSAERGQILFALLAGCFVATVAAYQAFPTRFSFAAWAAPLVAAVGLYALAATASVRSGAGAWMDVQEYAQALPIDWLTAGVGGGVAGYWVSLRMHESRFLERYEKEEEGG